MADTAQVLSEVRAARAAFDAELAAAGDERALEALKIKYMGKKGLIASFNRYIQEAAGAEEKKAVGREINLFREALSAELDRHAARLAEESYQAALLREKADVTAPGRSHRRGLRHPLVRVIDDILASFGKMGFLPVDGPEIESDYYNFEALNIPKDHPARDSQDSFYLDATWLLRTQTSPVQVRVMEKVRPPLAIVAPGRVFRRDATDASHSPMFHQVEGLYVAERVTMADLKGVLHKFCQEMFGREVRIRFRPDFFPFTEPSCEISISCVLCGGRGCSTCGGDGWVEILGAGMVNPLVLKNAGIDPEVYSGFAFGMGVERIAMIRWGVPDIRLFFENSHRFLRQFRAW